MPGAGVTFEGLPRRTPTLARYQRGLFGVLVIGQA